ncbi:MAG: fructosamine kinase family protein [Salegentibacter sp.]
MSGNKEIIQNIAKENQLKIERISALSGGDINDVFLLSSAAEKFVVKLNKAEKFPGMFEAEKAGLEALAKPEVIDVPKPLATGKSGSYSYLLLEYRETGRKNNDFWELFGRQLARLHSNSAEDFGFSQDNYIGSLPQYNKKKASASEFYITQRLKPQIEMAQSKGYNLGNIDSFLKNISHLIPEEAPALVHGDLWNGNYLVNSVGMPCLIDPAVAYAPREMDLGMMKLFGGFDEKLFSSYKEEFPLEPGFEERIPLWQLYYLLVHLNLFGTGYLGQVTGIIRDFS